MLKVAPQYYYTVRTGEVLVDQLKKVGVNVKIEQIEWGQWLSRVWREADYDFTIIGHAEAWDISNYANPKYYYRYDSPKFQELFKKSEFTLDDKARREQYVQLAEDATWTRPRRVASTSTRAWWSRKRACRGCGRICPSRPPISPRCRGTLPGSGRPARVRRYVVQGSRRSPRPFFRLRPRLPGRAGAAR